MGREDLQAVEGVSLTCTDRMSLGLICSRGWPCLFRSLGMSLKSCGGWSFDQFTALAATPDGPGGLASAEDETRGCHETASTPRRDNASLHSSQHNSSSLPAHSERVELGPRAESMAYLCIPAQGARFCHAKVAIMTSSGRQTLDSSSSSG